METSLVMITSVVIVNTATMILGDNPFRVHFEWMSQAKVKVIMAASQSWELYYKEPLKTWSQKKQHSVYSFAFVVEGDYFLRPSLSEVKQAI